jgi:rhodanese-related sulfurtransferase
MTLFPKVPWLPGVAAILAVLACYGTTLVVVLLSLLGISIAVNEQAWAGAISVSAALATLAIAASCQRHRSIWPTVIAVPGLALILWAMYGSYSRVIELAGFICLITATLLDLRMRAMSSAATNHVTWVEPGDLGDRLARNGAPIVIDVREPDEFAGPLGHIPDARNMPVGKLPDRLPELGSLKDKEIVLVCRTDRRSGASSAVLRNAGFRNVQVLRGGMERWNQEGRAVAGRPL